MTKQQSSGSGTAVIVSLVLSATARARQLPVAHDLG